MNENSKKLVGKVALVTGGSRGLGAEIARALADEGADVAVSYVSSAGKEDDRQSRHRQLRDSKGERTSPSPSKGKNGKSGTTSQRFY